MFYLEENKVSDLTKEQFRLIFDHGDVLKNSLTNVVIENLGPNGNVDESRELITKLHAQVTYVFDGLIERLQK